MKEICQLLSDQHFSFEYFLKIEFVRKISLKKMIFQHYIHEWVSSCFIGIANWCEPYSYAAWAFLFESSWPFTSTLSDVIRAIFNTASPLGKQASSVT